MAEAVLDSNKHRQELRKGIKDRKIEDRKMRCHFIFLSSIFLSAFVVRLRLRRAVYFVLALRETTRHRQEKIRAC
jgi:hypothetical protein